MDYGTPTPIIIAVVIAVVLTGIALIATLGTEIETKEVESLYALGIMVIIGIAAFFTLGLTFKLLKLRKTRFEDAI